MNAAIVNMGKNVKEDAWEYPSLKAVNLTLILTVFIYLKNK
jgi:hypothetical protein